MFISAAGYLLNTVQFGDGPETFVAHGGWVGGWELWQQPFELMQSKWRCIGYDHRGSGASTAPPSAITPGGLVDDLFTVLDTLGIDRCVLAGESLGALTCALAVERDPSRFSGLVLVDGSPAANRERMAPLIDGSRSDFPGTVRWFVDACVPEPESEHIRRWGRQILLRADPEAAARILEAHAEEEITPDFSAMKLPTLVIHGEEDAIIPVAAADAIGAAMADASVVRLPGVGHVPTLTRPEAVVTAIDEWWARYH